MINWLKGNLWYLVYFIIGRRAVHVAKKLGQRQDSGGWLYHTENLRIEALGTAVKVSVQRNQSDDGAWTSWKLVYWTQDSALWLRVWDFGPWAKEIGRLSSKCTRSH